MGFIVVATILLVASALFLFTFIIQQGAALRKAQEDARVAAAIAGMARQALADMIGHPLVDSSTSNVLSVTLREIDSHLNPLTRKELPK